MKEKTSIGRKVGAKGITLIALIITIIVMLILIAVTISVALNGGLIGKTQEAKTKTEEAQIAERDLLTGRIKIGDTWYDSLDEYLKNNPSEDQSDGMQDEQGGEIGGTAEWEQNDDGNIKYKGKLTEIKIGDYIEYKPDSGTYESTKLDPKHTGTTYNFSDLETEDLKWRILGVDKSGCLTLISSKPTSKNVFLEGATGYNNGVYILNDICAKLYSKAELGAKARSVTIEDVEAGLSAEGLNKRDVGSGYGATDAFTSELKYPVIYNEEKGSGIDTDTVKTEGIGVSEPYYEESQLTTKEEIKTATSKLTCTKTYYLLSSPPTTYCKNEKFHEMIFGTRLFYWLASRYVDLGFGYVTFGMRDMSPTSLDGMDIYQSNDSTVSRFSRSSSVSCTWG